MNIIEKYRNAIKKYYESSKRAYKSYPSMDIELTLKQINKESDKIISSKGLYDTSHLYIKGSAGSGKTTILDRITLYCVTNAQDIPIFIPLRTFSNSLIDLINIQIQRFVPELTHDLIILERGKGQVIRYLLDGFNEIPMSILQRFYMQLDKLVNSVKKSQYIVTSRTDPPSYFQSWSLRQISELSNEQIFDSLSKVVSKQGIEKIKSRPDLIEIARKPLFLNTILAGFQQNIDIGKYIAKEIPAYTTWRGHTISKLPPQVTPQILENTMEYLAFNLIKNQTEWINKEALHDIILASGIQNSQVDDVLQGLKVTDPIQTDKDRIRFRHRSYKIAYSSRKLRDTIKSGRPFEDELMVVLNSIDAKAVLEALYDEMTNNEFENFLKSVNAEIRSRIIALISDQIAEIMEKTSVKDKKKGDIIKTLELIKESQNKYDRRRKDIIVISIHGFNTRGNWKNLLSTMLARETDGERFIPFAWDCGNFRLGILNPFLRRRKVNLFQDFFNSVLSSIDISKNDICVVAHSFGTYILGKALLRFPEAKVDRIILLGSVLPRTFPWNKIKTKYKHVVNEVGGADFALKIAKYIPGLGTAGKDGFSTVSESITEIVFQFRDHSDGFGANHMKESWIPFFRSGKINYPTGKIRKYPI